MKKNAPGTTATANEAPEIAKNCGTQTIIEVIKC